MLYGTYLSAAGMARNQYQQDVIANNLANVDTVGFKRDLAVFRQRLQEARGAGSQFLPANLKAATGGSFVDPAQTDFSMGALQPTKRNLDVAVRGDGFLTVQDGNQVRLTRDGRLALVDGRLVRQVDGKAVLGDDGKEISLPTDASATDLRIDQSGNVWNKSTLIGQLGVVNVDHPQDLVKVGGNLFDTAGQQTSQIEPQLEPGVVEASTVDPATEMVEMIKNSRAFQMNAEMISLQNQSLARLVSELPKM